MKAREPGRIVWCDNRDVLAAAAADHVSMILRSRPRGALALPTGQTPIGLYRELVLRVHAGRLDLGQARLFNLDEYAGLDAEHPLSYARFLREHLLRPAHVPPAHVRLLRGDAADLEAETQAYDAALEAAGGLELAILGLGQNGHVAFNEPGADWQHRTHIVQLAAATRAVHREQTQGRFEIPTWALTMGIGTLRAARRIVLLVAGAKSDALGAWARGVPDPQWPVTSLLDHPDVTLFCDVALRAAVPGTRGAA